MFYNLFLFNSCGFGPAKLTKLKCKINGQAIEMTDSYNYLGLIFKQSGSVQFAATELLAKAKRAYLSMSNIFYENKKMKGYSTVHQFNYPHSPVCI